MGAVARLDSSGPVIVETCGKTVVAGTEKESIVLEDTDVALEDVLDWTDQIDEVPDETDATDGVGDEEWNEIAWGAATNVMLVKKGLERQKMTEQRVSSNISL